jgi:hypothetical protein
LVAAMFRPAGSSISNTWGAKELFSKTILAEVICNEVHKPAKN